MIESATNLDQQYTDQGIGLESNGVRPRISKLSVGKGIVSISSARVAAAAELKLFLVLWRR